MQVRSLIRSIGFSMAHVRDTIRSKAFRSKTNMHSGTVAAEYTALKDLLEQAKDAEEMRRLSSQGGISAIRFRKRNDAYRYLLPCGLRIDVSWKEQNPSWLASIFGFARSTAF
jgi:hypothetical protein